MQRAKLLVDCLSSLQSPISDEDLVDMILECLCGPLIEVCRAFATRTVSFDDLLGILMTEERHLKREKYLVAEINTPTAHHTIKSQSGSSQGRGRGLSSFQQSHDSFQSLLNQPYPYTQPNLTTPRPARNTTSAPLDISTFKCHNCQGYGHMARQCPTPRSQPNRFFPPTSHHTTTTNQVDSTWLLDSAATHHLAPDLGHLQLHSEYSGPKRFI